MTEQIKHEIKHAEKKHGEFTGTLEWKLFKLWEEVGEVIREINNIEETGKGYIELETELAQVSAVAYRFIKSIEDKVIEEKDGQSQLF